MHANFILDQYQLSKHLQSTTFKCLEIINGHEAMKQPFKTSSSHLLEPLNTDKQGWGHFCFHLWNSVPNTKLLLKMRSFITLLKISLWTYFAVLEPNEEWLEYSEFNASAIVEIDENIKITTRLRWPVHTKDDTIGWQN